MPRATYKCDYHFSGDGVVTLSSQSGAEYSITIFRKLYGDELADKVEKEGIIEFDEDDAVNKAG